MTLEKRFFNLDKFEVRMGDADQRMIAGYAAVFNSLSQEMWGFREQILPGAFADTLADDIRALWNHDTNIILGRTKSGTLRLKEDDIGLGVEIDPPGSAAAQVESIERGDVDQMSFGFRVLEQTWAYDDDDVLIRSLAKLKLYEVSPVAFPAYTATSVSLRSLPKATGGYLSDTFGFIPEVPAEHRRASDSAIDGQARARDARKRLLQLYSI